MKVSWHWWRQANRKAMRGRPAKSKVEIALCGSTALGEEEEEEEEGDREFRNKSLDDGGGRGGDSVVSLGAIETLAIVLLPKEEEEEEEEEDSISTGLSNLSKARIFLISFNFVKQVNRREEMSGVARPFSCKASR